MSADPISGIVYPVRTVAPDVTATMKATIDAIGVLIGALLAAQETFGAAVTAIIGSAPSSTTRKIRMEFSVGINTNSGGDFIATFPSGFAHGITYLAATLTESDRTSTGPGFILPALTLSTLGQYFGSIRTPLGAVYASHSATVSIVAVGW